MLGKMHIKVVGEKMSVILFIKGRFNYPPLFIGLPLRHWEIITTDSVMALYLHAVEVANHSSVYFRLICVKKKHVIWGSKDKDREAWYAIQAGGRAFVRL